MEGMEGGMEGSCKDGAVCKVKRILADMLICLVAGLMGKEYSWGTAEKEQVVMREFKFHEEVDGNYNLLQLEIGP